MATDQFLTSIFPASESEASVASSRNELHFGNLQDHIKELLAKYEKDKEKDKAVVSEPSERVSRDGRIGYEIVTVDISSQCGTMRIHKDRIEIESQSNFSSIRANVCVCKGKWMYEVLLGSKGIMQLGWATLRCTFTNEEGVGDTQDSYAYDGHRVRKWNVCTGKYGEEWIAGDIIGCLIDLDAGSISYTRNGHPLGVAFDNVRRGSGYAYFPAASLSFAEVVQMNFGGSPFRYPMEGYRAIQDVPEVEYMQAEDLFNCIDRLLPPPSRIAAIPPSLSSRSDTLAFLTTSHIFEQLAPLLMESYVVEGLLLPAFLNSCDIENPTGMQEGVKTLLELMWVCMEEFEIQACMEHLLWALVKGYWYGPVHPDYEKQLRHLTLALSFLRHEATCRFWLSGSLFHKFPFMLHVRPPDDRGIKEAYPVVWWEGMEVADDEMEVDEKREKYMESCQYIEAKVSVLENIQIEMCKILMQVDDANSKRDPRPMRMILSEKLRKMLQEHHSASSSLQPVQACSGPVMTCFLHRLTQAFRYHWDLWVKETCGAIPVEDAYVPHNIFYDDSVNFFDLARVGGIVSHLKKAYRDELKTARSSPVSRFSTLSSAFSSLVGSSSSSGTTASANSPTGQTLDKTLVELLDNIILMYHTTVHRQLSKVHGVTETMREHSKALVETYRKINKCPKDRRDVKAELERAKRVFTSEATEVARHMGWVKSVIFSRQKQEDLHWLLCCVLRTVASAQASGKLFVLMPEFYIENGIYLFQALWNYFMPLTMPNTIQGYEDTLYNMAIFLAASLCDDRIVNPDVCDTVIQGMATFVCYPDTLSAIENISEEGRMKLMRCLMSAYDKRTWVHTTWILVRFWRGDGFGFRHATSPDLIPFGISDQGGTIRAFTQKPCPSKVFQRMMRILCLDDQQLSNDFLNGVLNQLNWAFSEFVGILQEIQQATARLDASLPDARQLRTCGICFDLTVGLLRVLEMVCSVVPEVFTDFRRASAELTLVRLFQAVVQILNRVTASYRLFETLSRLHATDIERQDRYAVLAAVAGILVTLLTKASSESQKKTCAALLNEPSFQLESVSFLAGNPSGLATTGKPYPLFSFQKFKEVAESEVGEVEDLLRYLSEEYELAKFNKQESVDADNVCPICYAKPISVTFVPCGHSSCRPCITRHLMNSKECFFCKEAVKSLKSFERETSMEAK